MYAIIVISKKAYRIIGSEILLAIDGNPLMIHLYIIKNFLSKKIKNGNYSGKIFDMYFTSSSISSKVVIHIFDLIINS